MNLAIYSVVSALMAGCASYLMYEDLAVSTLISLSVICFCLYLRALKNESVDR